VRSFLLDRRSANRTHYSLGHLLRILGLGIQYSREQGRTSGSTFEAGGRYPLCQVRQSPDSSCKRQL
jgi:hypothetical protein